MAKQRILIVEDDMDLLQLMVMRLQDQFEVFTAADGLEGLKKARDLKPDCILLDIGLPKLSGQKVLREIRIKDSKTPILILTARLEAGIHQVVMKEGATASLIKPISKEKLLSEIRKVLPEETEKKRFRFF